MTRHGTAARIRGLLALLVVLGLTIGLPYVLLSAAGNPLASGLPDLPSVTELLLSPDDGTLFMLVLQIVGWLAWAVLALSILVELLAQLRGVRAPQLPGLQLPQGMARGLVATALVLFAAVPASPAVASVAHELSTAPPAAAALTTPVVTEVSPPVVTEASPAAEADLVTPPAPAPSTPVEPALEMRQDKDVVVQAGDTLWGIAEEELGDGTKYPELYEASRDVAQPGGDQLTDPDLIYPGWTIQVPGAGEPVQVDAPPPTVPEAPAPHEPPAATPESADGAGAETPQSGSAVGESAETGNAAAPAPTGDTAHAPSHGDGRSRTGATPATSTETRADTPQAAAPASAEDTEALPWQVTTASGVGTLLLAGVATLVTRRRRDQQRTRRPGQEVPLPAEALAAFQQTMLASADHLSVETIDLALRSLAILCVRAGRPLPALRAARLTASTFELFLEHPTLLPQPWTNAGDSTVWVLSTADVDRLEPVDPAAVPAPYPCLVTLGYDEDDGHVLLNLEHLGTLGVTGDSAATGQVLTAVAVELASSVWADELQVTVVGVPGDLEAVLRTGRVRHLPTVDMVVEDLEQRARSDRSALAAVNETDLYSARVSGTAPDTWDPEIVLLGDPVTDDQRARLTDLLAGLPHVALATVTGGDTVGEWSLHVAPGGTSAELSPIGLRLRPQRLPAGELEHLARLSAMADPAALEGTPTPEPSVAEVEAVVPVAEPQTAVGEPASPVAPGPRIRMLGPVDLVGAHGNVDDRHRARLMEYAAFLTLNPGASLAELDEAIWPGREQRDNLTMRTSATARLRRWLGKDSEGQDHLPRHQAGDALAFGPGVTTDIAEWDRLVGTAPLQAPTENLQAALQLVRGVPFHGVHRRRYGWAEPTRQRLIAEIVDASFALAKRHLMEGRWSAADDAVAVGLLVEPAQEALWRMRILAAHESHDAQSEAEAIGRLLTITERLECNLQPETEQLLAALKDPGSDFDRIMANAL